MTNMISYPTYVLLFFVCWIYSVCAVPQENGDRDSLRSLVKRIYSYGETYPREQVYLHLDNTGYFEEETIWFKAYVVRADKGIPTDLSKVLYVELLNNVGDVVETCKCAVIDGQADGSLNLKNVFKSGFYEIRAYTRYMTNWGASECFSRVVPVFCSPRTDGDYSSPVMKRGDYSMRVEDVTQKRTDGTDEDDVRQGKHIVKGNSVVSFFPEGGHMVKGIESVVAFQVSDKTLGNFSTSGCVVDEDGEVVVDSVMTWMDGRGMFCCTPQEKRLFFRYADAEGNVQQVQLPTPLEEGCCMSVNTLGDEKIVATVHYSRKAMGKTYGMTWMHRGKILAYKDFVADNEVMSYEFGRQKYPEGVNTITLFDETGRIMAERLVFIIPQPKASDSISVELKTRNVASCGLVKMELQTTPETTFSFSAMDVASMTGGNYQNIKTWMLLSSELKGHIAHPAYYLEADDMPHRLAVDLLMMVQGWRKYDWKVMAGTGNNPDGTDGHKFSTRLRPIENALYIDGTLVGKNSEVETAGVNLHATLYNKKGDVLKGDIQTDDTGRYVFEIPNCYGEWALLVNTDEGSNAKKKFRLGIDRNFSPSPRNLHPKELELAPANVPNIRLKDDSHNTSVTDYIPMQRDNYLLPEVKIKSGRIYDRARDYWTSEKEAQAHDAVYYDCGREAEAIADAGLESPYFSEWLIHRDVNMGKDYDVLDRVSGVESINIYNVNTIDRGDGEGRSKDYDGTMMESETFRAIKAKERDNHPDLVGVDAANIQCKVFKEGPSYKGRPIVWIIDNSYYCTTGFRGIKCEVEYMAEVEGLDLFPSQLDEVKSVYITEDSEVINEYIHSSMLEGQKPVTVFVYSRDITLGRFTGLRRTYFQGYNEPQTFQMEDYSVLPPMEDFRRTLYWNPNVKTDSEGKATVEFYNNSSCTEMFISAEGITKGGRFVVY